MNQWAVCDVEVPVAEGDHRATAPEKLATIQPVDCPAHVGAREHILSDLHPDEELRYEIYKNGIYKEGELVFGNKNHPE